MKVLQILTFISLISLIPTDGLANEQAKQLILNGAKVVGSAKLTSSGEGTSLVLGQSSETMPVKYYGAEVRSLYTKSDNNLYLTNQESSVGDAYFLPWDESKASIMTLPDGPGSATTFVTPALDSCGVAIGRNADGQAVVMHLNYVETTEIDNISNRIIEIAINPKKTPALIRQQNALNRQKIDVISMQYRNAISDAVNKGYFESTPEVILPDTYFISPILQADGSLAGQKAYVTGTLESQGWTFRASTVPDNVKTPEVLVTTLAENIKSTNNLANTEPFRSQGESKSSRYEELEVEKISIESFKKGVESLNDLSRVSQQEQGVRISEAIEVMDQVSRIYGERPLPRHVITLRSALLHVMDSSGVRYGSYISDNIVSDFQQVAEHDSTIASMFKNGGRVARGFEYAGKVFFVAGVGTSIYRVVVSDAPALAAAKEGGGWAGGIAAGAAASATVSWLDVFGPYGWAADLVVGVGAGVLGFWGGQTLGEVIYDSAHFSNEDPLPSALRALKATAALSPKAAGSNDGSLVYRRKSDGQVFFKSMTNDGQGSGVYLAHPVGDEWALRGAGDVDGDGVGDLIWQHDNGQVLFWKINSGGKLVGGREIHASVPPYWALEAIGDVNGDGTDDLIWQHDNGQVYYWSMKDGALHSGSDIHTPVDPAWSLEGAGDVNGDGTDDIIWKHNNGQVHWWGMKNAVRVGGATIGGWHVPATRKIKGIGDVNGDGTDDIIVQLGNGIVNYWRMLGGVPQASVRIGTASSDWELSGVADLYGPHIKDAAITQVPPQRGDYFVDWYDSPHSDASRTTTANVLVYKGIEYWVYMSDGGFNGSKIIAYSLSGSYIGEMYVDIVFPWKLRLDEAGENVRLSGSRGSWKSIPLADLPRRQ